VDVNGTRFHLVLGERDWLPRANGGTPASDLEWDTDAVRLRKLLPSFPARQGSTPLSIDARRGAARDRFGHWYWISDDGHEIRVSRMRRRPSTRFWSAEDAARGCIDEPDGLFTRRDAATVDPLQLAGLAVTTDHYLVVGRLKPAGLLIFDLRGGGAPLALDWPAAAPFTPFDISAAADGGAWILDRHARTLWRLDRYFRVVWSGGSAPSSTPVGFTPIGADGQVCPPAVPISDHSPLHLVDVDAPIAVEALPDGSVLVLDDPSLGACSVVHRYRLDGTHYAIRLDTSLNPAPAGDDADVAPALPLRAHDFAFVRQGHGRPLTGTLFVAAAWGTQAYAFTFTSEEDAFSLSLCRQYLPLRRFTGKALAASAGHVYYDIDERWIGLVEYPSPRFVRHGTITLPTGTTQAFDGKEVRCVWHRFLIDGCIPYETAVTVETRSADRIELLADLPWKKQPRLYRRGDGSEIPYYRAPIDDDGHAGTWELLLQDVVGRYLQVRLTIEGTGKTSARLSTIRIHYPRFSYLKEYLPAVYREDRVSASFVERYLANVEGTFTTLEGKIEHVETLFDPQTAPAAALEWLAAWLGATLDFKWSDATRRLFLTHAPQMFRERGTCAGLVRAIRLALDRPPTADIFACSPCGTGAATSGFGVRVVERFRTRRAPGVVFGDPTELLGPGSTTNVNDWTPARGPLPLHQRFREFLEREYADRDGLNAAWNATFTGFDDPALQLAAVRPSSGRRGADWQRFIESDIGFTYAVVRDTDEPLYSEFLARRYGQPSAVNAAYRLEGSNLLTTFADVRPRLWDAYLRQSLPSGSVWLQDWIQFVSTVLPMERTAHRFTVLVPVGLDDGPDVQLDRRNLAERITQIEKPAHASFDVKLYWGMFRVGEARVALDTLIAAGSRSVALVLDRGVSALGAALLAYTEPWNATDHLVVGREGSDAASTAATCGCGCGGACGCGGTGSHKTAHRTTSGTGGCGCQ
jgi:phage tail-like protein